MAAELDPERIEELHEFFKDCDSNNDSRIQKNEFSQLLANLGQDVTAEEIAVGFSELDRDRDGAIDFEEFLSYWQE